MNNTQIPVEDYTKKAEERARERQKAWDLYIDAICKGLPEQEISKRYWAAAGLSAVLS